MSRIIKFRGWCEECSTFVELDLTTGSSGLVNCECGDVHLHDLTIEQFTDLLDREGKEIWEGDLVEYEPKCRPTPVFYDEYIGAFQPFAATHYPVTDWIVRGNIHTDPHLLTDGEKK